MAGGSTIVVPYDREWPRLFEAERIVLVGMLSPWLDGEIEHIGSTSVPGLSAKPVIDMIAPVQDLGAARNSFESLQTLGYQYREHRPEAHAFHKPALATWSEETHHLHLTERGSQLWRERIAFRDALLRDPGLAAEYQDWKVRNARGTEAESAYAGDKSPFVARVLADAGITLKPDSDRLSPAAREARTR